MTPGWPSGSYRFGSGKRDRPPIPPRQKIEAFDMLMIRWIYPPLSTHQKIKNEVFVQKMRIENETWRLHKNKIGPEWGRE